MIEAPDFLPLGSIVTLKGNSKKLMVIGRGLYIADKGVRGYCDYSFCLYPEGVLGDQVIYANTEMIDEVLFKGYDSGENEEWSSVIRVLLKSKDIKKADFAVRDEW